MTNIHARLLANHITTIGLYTTLCEIREGTFLLESASEGVWSRYPFVGVRYDATLIERGGEAVWLDRELTGIGDGDPLDILRQTLAELTTPATGGLPPFHAGMVGYLSCNVVRRLGTLPGTCADDFGLPELVMMLASQVAVLDHRTHEVHLTFNVINYDGTDEGVKRTYHEALVGVEEIAGRLAEPAPSLVGPARGGLVNLEIRRQHTPAEYERAIRVTIAGIETGEAFQMMVSQRFDVPTDSDALEVYRTLRLANPSPYLYLLQLPRFAVIGSSPEALVVVRDGVATTRPIASSQPQGSTEVEDRELAVELLADPKKRAEHLILVDLGRDDLGRICEPGSVTVHGFAQIHRHSHIIHLEAAVSGRLAEGYTALDATLSCFPAGTLSGAPKVRAMEVIDQLEINRRGLYDGAVGYFDFAGSSGVATAIRTTVPENGIAHVQMSVDVVADSVPGGEDTKYSHEVTAVITTLRHAAKLGGAT